MRLALLSTASSKGPRDSHTEDQKQIWGKGLGNEKGTAANEKPKPQLHDLNLRKSHTLSWVSERGS